MSVVCSVCVVCVCLVSDRWLWVCRCVCACFVRVKSFIATDVSHNLNENGVGLEKW